MKQLICILLSLLTTSALSSTWAVSVADVILTSEKVITMTGNRQAQPLAVAIKGEHILWLGDIGEMQTYRGPSTKIIDFGRQAILPGFIDAHGHASYLAMTTQAANIASPPVGPVENIADLQNTLRQYMKERQIDDGEWVIGLGYDDSLLFENRHPNRDDLDAVSTKHPIYLVHVSGHLAAANSRALARVGINAESANPAGGIIRRRPGTAIPDGVLEESAQYPLRRYMNAPVQDPVATVQTAMQTYASNGITTVQDGAASPETINLMRAADAAGYVDLDVIMYPMGQTDPQAIQAAYNFGEYEGRVKVGGVKLMLDGSPQGKTAYMTKPYLVPPSGQDAEYRGYPAIPQARADDLVKSFADNEIKILAHANGDAAADMLITAVRNAEISSDHRTVMIHAQTVREDQLTDMKTLGMIPSFFSAHSFYWGDWHRDSVFGVERASRISPTASTVSRGMVFTIHNDAPIVPPDMIRLLWATTNRVTRSGKVLGADQRISVYDALKGMTRFAAYQHFEESMKGTLEVGKFADFVVLSEDPLTMQAADLLNLKVRATYSRGLQVFPRN